MLTAIVKPEPGSRPRPIWDWPYPKGVDVSLVPPRSIHERARQKPIDPEGYLRYYQGQVGYLEQQYNGDNNLCLIVIQEIERVPGIWSVRPRTIPSIQEWAKVGAGVYQRTGEMVAIATLRKIWTRKKVNLKSRIATAFLKKKLTVEELEMRMWEVGAEYAVIRFYRAHLYPFEKDLREKGLYRIVMRDGKAVREIAEIFTIDSDDEDGLMRDFRAEFQRIHPPQEISPQARAEMEAAREQEVMMKSATIRRKTPKKRKPVEENRILEQAERQAQRGGERQNNELLRQMLGEERRHQVHAPQMVHQAPQAPPTLTQEQSAELHRKIARMQRGAQGIMFTQEEQAFLQYQQRMRMMQQHQAQHQQMQAYAQAPPPYPQPPPQPAPSKHQLQMDFCTALLSNFINEHPDRVVLMTSVIQNTLELLSGDLHPDTEQTEVFQMLSEKYPNYIQRFK